MYLKHDQAELLELEAKLAHIGPGWTLFASDPQGLLRAERPGTFRHQECATTPPTLLELVRQAEDRLEQNRARVEAAGASKVQIGLANTSSHRPAKGH